jgi:uncharacterized protein YebE (UPF0316 family)
MNIDLIYLLLVIFVARILDMSFKTFRTIFLIEGKNYYAALFGFLEALIWILVIRDAITSDEGVLYVALAYGLGYALGHIVGITLLNYFFKQTYQVIIITSHANGQLIKALDEAQFGITKIEASGLNDSKKYYLFLEIQPTRLKHLKQVINILDPQAFMIMNKSKEAINGYFFD